jgi:hypothetical protein
MNLIPCPWLPRKAWRVRRQKSSGGRPPKVTDEQLLSLVTRGEKHRASFIVRSAQTSFRVSSTTAKTRLCQLVKQGRIKTSHNLNGYLIYQAS